LCVSVNGYLEGSQRISSALSELTLSIKGEEQVNFVEIFSEQGVRLLLLNINEPPPNGSDEQTTRVELSDNRTLDLVLRFRSPWPTLHVTYHHPTYTEPGLLSLEQLDHESTSTVLTLPAADQLNPNYSTLGGRWQGSLLKLSRSVADWRFWIRPATVTTVFSLLLFASLLVFYRPTSAPPASAGVLLQRAAVAEEAAASIADQVLHRTINLEERSPRQEIFGRRRIEVWQSAEKGITARRLYDEKGQLVAGDWRRADGVQTLYSHGQRPRLQLVPEKRGGAEISGEALTFDNVWQLSPSAKEFTSLISSVNEAHLEELSTSYVVNYQREQGNTVGLVRATLVLSRTDLHAVEQTLTIQQGNEQRAYRFVEMSYERRPTSAVAPAVFEPDPEFLGPAARRVDPAPDRKLLSTPPQPVMPVRVVATAELEVEVLQQLNQAGAFLGEQVSLTRTPEGTLRVDGIVDTEQRKRELLRTLEVVAHNPAVRIAVETVAEAQKREPAQRSQSQSSSAISIQPVEVTQAEIPVYAELRQYLQRGKRIPNEQVDQEIGRITRRVLDQSIQARLHALALKQIVERFSPSDLQTMDPEARRKWRSLINEHVQAFLRETTALRRELEPMFATAAPAEMEAEITNDAELARAVKHLFELASTNDESVSTSFSLFSGRQERVLVKSPQFWRSFRSAEKLAERIAVIK
jgi:hypothetical protein